MIDHGRLVAGPAVLLQVAVTGSAYYLASRLGPWLAQPSEVCPLWPAAGVAVASLLVLGQSSWPGIAIAGLLAGLSNGLPADVGTAAAQTVGPVAAVAVLSRLDFDRSLGRVADVLLLAVTAAGSILVSAAIALVAMAAAGVIPWSSWLRFGTTWWIGDVMGILLVTPVLLAAHRACAHGPADCGRVLRTVALIAATGLGTAVIFSGGLPVVFLAFPIAWWSALRFGPAGAAVANLAVTTVAVWATAVGRGPFADLSPTRSLVVLEAFNAAVTITSLILAAAVATAARLGIENARLHREVSDQLDETRRSRARIVEAGDLERRRVERNLHDGTQQRLASLSCTLSRAGTRVCPQRDPDLHHALRRAQEEVVAAMSELRELAQGIHPAILTEAGLAVALGSLARRAVVPVEMAAPDRRYPPVVEGAAYFVVSEALANIAKHARASKANVLVEEDGPSLTVVVSDDGIGGADPGRGSGLVGMADRVAALHGRFSVSSIQGLGTTIRAELPCAWS